MKPPCPICYDEPGWWCWLAHQHGGQLLAMWLIGALAVVWICSWPKNENIAIAAELGVVDPHCTLQQVCTPGYTKDVRPSAAYTNALKEVQMLELGLAGDPGEYEEDHVIPLELCGAPRDHDNLRPQLWPKARRKDVLENRFHRAVCKGYMSLQEAQREIVGYE